MSNDRAYFESGSVMAPASDIFAVTLSDDTDDPNGPFRGIVMDAAGAIKVRTKEGQDITLPSGLLAAGVIHPLAVVRVWSTGTGTQAIYGVV